MNLIQRKKQNVLRVKENSPYLCQSHFGAKYYKMSINLVIATIFAVLLLTNGSPIDTNGETQDIIVCPEGILNGCELEF